MPIYIYSFMMNVVMATAYFVNPLRASQAGLGAWMVAGQFWTGGTVYMLSGLLISRWISERNNQRFIMLGSALGAVSCIGCILLPQNMLMFLWVALIASGHACFSIGFQSYLRRAENTGRGPCASAGFYIFSFSMGFSLAPALNGYLMDYADWRICYGYCAVLALLTGIALRAPVSTEDHVAPAADGLRATDGENWRRYAAKPDLIMVGWAIGLSLIVTHFGFFKANFNLQGVHLGFSNSQFGLINFIHAVVQGIAGLLLARTRDWMYRPFAVCWIPVCGIVSMFVFMYSTQPSMFMFGSLLTGAFGGCGMFLLIFHAMAHPLRSARYISINEFLIGLGGIAGNTLALGNAWIDDPQYNELYPVAIAIIVAALIFQVGYMLTYTQPQSGSNVRI